MVYNQTSFHHVRPGVSHLSNINYCVNAAPCRWLALSNESVKCERLYQPHRTTTRTERLLTWIIVTRPDQCPEGQKMFVRLSNVPNVTHDLPVRSRLNPIWELWKPWGLYPINVEGGLHSPFLVKTKLDKVTKNNQLLCTFSRESILVRGITSAYGQRCSRASSKSLDFFNQPFLVPKPHSRWSPILDLRKPNLSETIMTSLQQGE